MDDFHTFVARALASARGRSRQERAALYEGVRKALDGLLRDDLPAADATAIAKAEHDLREAMRRIDADDVIARVEAEIQATLRSLDPTRPAHVASPVPATTRNLAGTASRGETGISAVQAVGAVDDVRSAPLTGAAGDAVGEARVSGGANAMTARTGEDATEKSVPDALAASADGARPPKKSNDAPPPIATATPALMPAPEPPIPLRSAPLPPPAEAKPPQRGAAVKEHEFDSGLLFGSGAAKTAAPAEGKPDQVKLKARAPKGWALANIPRCKNMLLAFDMRPEPPVAVVLTLDAAERLAQDLLKRAEQLRAKDAPADTGVAAPKQAG